MAAVTVGAGLREASMGFVPAMFDYAAFDRAPLQHDPFDFLIVPGFLTPTALAAINRDFPKLESPGNVAIDRASGYGPAFAHFLDELQGEELRRHFEQKFGLNLSGTRPTISVRARCEATDGNIHTDHKSKLLTVLLYFNEDWPHEGGRLRLLRSKTDIEDYAAEVLPCGGAMLAFRRTDNSWHGHKPHVGERRILQMSYTKGGELARAVSGITKPIRRLLGRS